MMVVLCRVTLTLTRCLRYTEINNSGAIMSSEKITYKTPLAFQNQVTGYLHGQIAQQKKILQAVQSLLPESLAKQVCHCLIKDQKLLIYTDSAVWASQLRFYNPMILDAITTLTKEIVSSVQLRITTQPLDLVTKSERKARLPSPEKIAELKSASFDMPDESLRLAFLKLSATLERLSKQAKE